MSIAAYQKVINVKAVATTSSTAYRALPGNTASLNFGGDMLDDTTFASTGWRSRLRGLKDYSVPVTCVYTSTDAALAIVRAGILAGTAVDFQYLPNGTAGFAGSCQVESYNLTGDVAGFESVDVSLQSAGAALTTV